MEDEWTPQLTSLLDIPRCDLPMIWDADFMLGPSGVDGRRRPRSPAALPIGCGRCSEWSEETSDD
jgi:Domain of unknown function (DUF6815)